MLCGIWTVIHIVLTFFIPESPYFFMYKNKDDKANVSMTKLRDGNATDIADELTMIKREIELQKANQDTFMKVMANKANRKSLLIGIGCMFFQQTSGINAIIFYMGYIFDEIGSSITSNTSVIAVGIVQLVMTLVAMTIIDKAGRRLLLIVSAVVMSLSFFGLGLYLDQSHKLVPKDSILSWLPLILIALYISAFSLGFGPIPWVVMGEIFSNEVKPYGTSLATATNWILVFAVTFLTFVTTESIGFLGLFWVYSLFCMLGAIFVWYIVPETKNNSLNEIQLKLSVFCVLSVIADQFLFLYGWLNLLDCVVVMTSFGEKEIHEGNCMPTFKVQGQVYRFINNLLLAEGAQPEFLKIYFVSHVDQEFELITHADMKPPNEHRGRYNAPIIAKVAALLIDEDKGPRDIVFNSRNGRLQRIGIYNEINKSQGQTMSICGLDLGIPCFSHEQITRNMFLHGSSSLLVLTKDELTKNIVHLITLRG
ncbi:hypothetical protein AGLY_016561 [Aphis glycines]|uniref:Major facilitator superfamily (MFS) profile domain-containing protein n=1 Tax=Aphis glycines TaxID=307491 RepID=A0A6G0SX06_APHGL|nr:hypothetical protein AGLY_016561 [Aphis glycines]